MNQENDILSAVRDGIGVITLNRPQVLNALSLEMIRQIAALLSAWEKDEAVERIVFAGAGDRAFCAGGDIKAFYHAGMEYRKGVVGAEIPRLFFAEEYALNRRIFHYPKPTMAVMDGITMGGGYGIAGHCKMRVATERTVFAMPEVGIGFFPDVGASYHLTRAPGGWGRYLALTGNSVGAGDMIAAGLADGYVEDVQAVLDGQEVTFDEAPAPETDPSDFESKNVEDLQAQLETQSPLSVCVTDRHLRELKGADFDTVIEADYARLQHFIRYPDFYEGIRAALITKTRDPIWEPARFEDVTQEDIARYFEPAAGKLAA